MANEWYAAYDALSDAERKVDPDNVDHLLKVAEVKALLSIAQEISVLHHEGINPDYARD